MKMRKAVRDGVSLHPIEFTLGICHAIKNVSE